VRCTACLPSASTLPLTTSSSHLPAPTTLLPSPHTHPVPLSSLQQPPPVFFTMQALSLRRAEVGGRRAKQQAANSMRRTAPFAARAPTMLCLPPALPLPRHRCSAPPLSHPMRADRCRLTDAARIYALCVRLPRRRTAHTFTSAAARAQETYHA